MPVSLAISNKLLLSVGIGIGVTVVSGVTYWYYQVYRKNFVIPKKWQRVGTLEELYLYPLKSGCPVKLDAASEGEISCELLGMEWNGLLDRSLMLLDEKNQMITGRTYPKMVLIESKIIGTRQIEFNASDRPSLALNFDDLINKPDDEKSIVETAVWGAKLQVMLCGEIYDKWFSKAILDKENGLRLAFYHHEKPVRDIDRDMKHERFITRKDTGALGDATSYMLMNLASVDDLNTRLKSPVQAIQFRGNFYLKMDQSTPYAEDNWNWIRIGQEATFRKVAPCTRCIMPNINPNTGERDPDLEPQRTLKTYRKVANYRSPPLGIHMGLRQRGNVKVNDIIYIASDE